MMTRPVLGKTLAAGPMALVLILGLLIGPKYDHFVLPSFDGHVYATMAESPRIFTLAPWGYRILAPWVVHYLPLKNSAAGFYWLNLFLLAGSIFVMGLWLRRLGFSRAAAALITAACGLSPPFRVLLDYQILVDPLAVFLLVVILNELIAPDLLSLMALFALAALTKETTLPFLALVPIHLIAKEGLGRGLRHGVLVAAPALFLTFVLRVSWGHPAVPPVSPIIEMTIERLEASALAFASSAMLSGVLVLAIVGAFRERSTPLRLQAGLMWACTFGLILANPYHYSASDLPRLSVFAWPAMLPLALSGLGFKRTIAPTQPQASGSRARTIAASTALVLCLFLVAWTDPYERAPFPANPDPVAIVGRVRESLKTAEILETGGSFEFDARYGRFASPVTEAFNLTEARKQRWFLHGGFGKRAAFGNGAPVFTGRGHLLLPLYRPRNAAVTLEIEGGANDEVMVSVAGRRIASIETNAGARTFRIPASLLIRGDNVIELRGREQERYALRHFAAALDPPFPKKEP